MHVNPGHRLRSCASSGGRHVAARRIRPLDRVASSAASVERIVAGGETVYGVNTGFGLLASTRIPAERLAELQRNLILSHSCGLGDAAAAPCRPADDRAQAARPRPRLFGRPAAGHRRAQALLDQDAMPLIPAQGSVGASGDLAPLAHLIAALMGEGRIDLAGDILPAADALDKLGLSRSSSAPRKASP